MAKRAVNPVFLKAAEEFGTPSADEKWEDWRTTVVSEILEWVCDSFREPGDDDPLLITSGEVGHIKVVLWPIGALSAESVESAELGEAKRHVPLSEIIQWVIDEDEDIEEWRDHLLLLVDRLNEHLKTKSTKVE